MRALRRVLLVTILVVLPVLSSPSAVAVALPGCEGEPYPVPEAATDGVSGMLSNPVGKDDAKPLIPLSEVDAGKRADGSTPYLSEDLYREYGGSGLTWHTVTESCVDKMGSAPVAAMADFIWSIAVTINLVTIRVYELAHDGAVSATMGMFVQDAVLAMSRSFYWPLLPIVVILGAVWMMWTGLVERKAVLTAQGAGWMVGAVVGAVVVLGAPGDVMQAAGRVTLIGSDAATWIVYPVPTGDGEEDRCPRGAAPISAGGDRIPSTDAIVAENSERLWSGLICEPWMAGEVGTGPKAEEFSNGLGTMLLGTQAVSHSELRHIESGALDGTEAIDMKNEKFKVLVKALETKEPTLYAMFSGDQAMPRLGIAMIALAAALLSSGLVFLVSLALVVLQLGFLLLVLMAPLFLLAGVHPGKGRILLTRWAETALGMLLKQIFLTFLLALLLKVIEIVLASGVGWGGEMVILALITVAVMVFRERFVNLVAQGVDSTSRVVTQYTQIRRGDSKDGTVGGDGSDSESGRGAVRRDGPGAPGRGRGGSGWSQATRQRILYRPREGGGWELKWKKRPAAEGGGGAGSSGAGPSSGGGGAESGARRRRESDAPRRDPKEAPARTRGTAAGAASSDKDTDAQQARAQHNPRPRGSTAGDTARPEAQRRGGNAGKLRRRK